jgi:pyrroline-5-carboxylate reductase
VIPHTIGFIGAGNMAEALIRGFIETKTCGADQLWASDVNAERLTWMSQTFGVKTTPDNALLAASCQVIILAIKPQQIPVALKSLRPHFKPEHLLLSIAAGIPTGYLEKCVAQPLKIVRIMPNTPAKLRAGASAFCLGKFAGDAEKELVQTLFAAVGTVVCVAETDMNAVTALSGSGPAYFFKICELMTQAGQSMGLTESVAKTLSIQTMLGAARMLAETGQEAGELRQAVTSKGGTTEAALTLWEQTNFSEIFKNGLLRARDRALELTPPEPEL